jgi:hypothetical protein
VSEQAVSDEGVTANGISSGLYWRVGRVVFHLCGPAVPDADRAGESHTRSLVEFTTKNASPLAAPLSSST